MADMPILDWLAGAAGLAGKKLQSAVAVCEAKDIENAGDLLELHQAGKLDSQGFTDIALTKIEKGLGQLGGSSGVVAAVTSPAAPPAARQPKAAARAPTTDPSAESSVLVVQIVGQKLNMTLAQKKITAIKPTAERACHAKLAAGMELVMVAGVSVAELSHREMTAKLKAALAGGRPLPLGFTAPHVLSSAAESQCAPAPAAQRSCSAPEPAGERSVSTGDSKLSRQSSAALARQSSQQTRSLAQAEARRGREAIAQTAVICEQERQSQAELARVTAEIGELRALRAAHAGEDAGLARIKTDVWRGALHEAQTSREFATHTEHTKLVVARMREEARAQIPEAERVRLEAHGLFQMQPAERLRIMKSRCGQSMADVTFERVCALIEEGTLEATAEAVGIKDAATRAGSGAGAASAPSSYGQHAKETGLFAGVHDLARASLGAADGETLVGNDAREEYAIASGRRRHQQGGGYSH
jgi:hypothetical protein